MTQPPVRVGIVGAGIGGLSLALALRERGLQADVFEQASELTEIGAAIGLSANAIREFARLGLAGGLTAASTIPTELIYRHWRDGSRIAAHPVRQDGWYEKQFGAPFSAFTAPTCRKFSALPSTRSTCTWGAGWSTSPSRPARWCWSSPTGGRTRPTWWSAPTGCVRRSAAGSPGPTT
jgi:hypothetical protein